MNDIRIEKLITELTAYIHSRLSDYRYQHSCRVAAFAEELARRYGYDKKQQRLCYLAGIAHDMCKEEPAPLLLRTVQQDGQPVSPEEAVNTELLHGRAAAVRLREHYGIHQKKLLNAVRFHTSASSKFDALGKIIYIADKIEPGRKNCGYLREKVSELSLDALFCEVLHDVIAFVEQKGQKVQGITYKVYRYMQATLKMQNTAAPSTYSRTGSRRDKE